MPPRTPTDFASLFRYNDWANTRVLDTLRAADAAPERAIELLSHLIRAQDVWYGRVQNTDHADLTLWAEEDLATCAERAKASIRRWKKVLDACSADDLDRSVAYTNSTGTAFETPLRDLLTHVVNHGSHHRGQIALVLREAGIAPPPTGYIFYVRDQDMSDV